jgi:sigma-B regulation protein RsbU (phosphoserine phosphatase)
VNLDGGAVFEAAFEYAYNAMIITDADFGGGGPQIQRCNPAFCAMTGYSKEELIGQSPRILQGPETDRKVIDQLSRKIWAGEFFEGSTINYRKDGAPYIVRWNISPVRDSGGAIVAYISIQQDITALVEADERVRSLAQQLKQKADRLKAELDSAASYMSSILPRGLTGKVSVSSRYLPSSEIGGDSFDYLWIDDDHLLVYLIDVSGHGVEPALLSVSVHNMLRARSISTETLSTPEALLTELNHRFQMEQHNDHYFTMWYGVYQASSRILCYASAGAPPALVFTYATRETVEVTELPTTSAPVGMFKDTVFTAHGYEVPHGCQILICSDGASEITLADHRQLTWADFVALTSRGAAAAPEWTLDALIGELKELTPSGAFEDDCSLIKLTFD